MQLALCGATLLNREYDSHSALALALAVSLINFFIGGIYGAIEGYYGGTVDLVMERISDILADVPFMVVATLFQLHLAEKVGTLPSLLFAFVLTGWVGMAARVRMQFYRFKGQEYVLAARSNGQGYLSTYPHIILFPALFISILEISFNLFGNGLRDAFNPVLRGSEE